MKIIFKIFIFLVFVSGTKVHAGELKTSLFQFDVEHEDQQAISLGFNYNFDHSYATPVGKVEPLLGVFMTEYYAGMVYAGAKIDYKVGRLIVTPSFSPGLYSYGSDKRQEEGTKKGRSKNLGQILNFKSQIDIGLDIGSLGVLSFGLSHISNGDLANHNPGVNNYHFNFAKEF